MAVKYSFILICIIFNQYFPVFHYFVYIINENMQYDKLSFKLSISKVQDFFFQCSFMGVLNIAFE